jgi:hypothetical protein
MQTSAVDHFAGGCARKVPDRRKAAAANADIAQGLTVMVDDSAALEDQIVDIGHVRAALDGA